MKRIEFYNNSSDICCLWIQIIINGARKGVENDIKWSGVISKPGP
jgi:hypothetical protein